MKTHEQASLRTGWWIAGAAAALYLVVGLVDLPNIPYTGYTASNNQITSVTADTPAEQAGLQVGDQIVVNGGIDVLDRRALLRQPRAKIGEARELVVERDGERLTLAIDNRGLPRGFLALFVASTLIAALFVVTGLWVHRRHGTTTSRTLAFFGLLVPLIFTLRPYFDNADLRLLAAALSVLPVALIPACLVHFQLLFPRRPQVDRPWIQRLLYGVAVAVGAFAALSVYVPSLQGAAGFTLGPTMLVYLLLSVVLLLRNYVLASADERVAHGLHVLLLGLLVGTLPAILGALVRTLPGANFYFLTMALVPLALAYAVTKDAASRGPERVSGSRLDPAVQMG